MNLQSDSTAKPEFLDGQRNRPISIAGPARAGNGHVTISSKDIAATTEKEHKHVLRDIRVMIVGLYGTDDQTFDDLIRDGANLDHQGIQILIDNRDYVEEIILDREHAMTLVTGYDVKLRKRVVDKLSELEAGAHPALPDFSNPVAAARAWADEKEARQIAERTKAQIGSRREATAMNAASQAVKKLNKLQIELDRSTMYATVKRMEKLYQSAEFNWRDLKQASLAMGLPPLDVHDANYGSVKAYHADVWQAVYGVDVVMEVV